MRALGLVLLGWPCWDGIRMVWPGWHQGGLLSTRDLSMSPHNHPIQGWGDPRPPLLPHRSSWAQGSRGLGLPAVGLELSTMGVSAIAAVLAITAWTGISAAGQDLKALLRTSSFPPLKFPNPYAAFTPLRKRRRSPKIPRSPLVYHVGRPDWKG